MQGGTAEPVSLQESTDNGASTTLVVIALVMGRSG
jgi:hypothetical protein